LTAFARAAAAAESASFCASSFSFFLSFFGAPKPFVVRSFICAGTSEKPASATWCKDPTDI
jgi:hypothetical protein